MRLIFMIFVDVVTYSRCPLWQKSDLAGMSLVSTAGSFYPTIDLDTNDTVNLRDQDIGAATEIPDGLRSPNSVFSLSGGNR